MICTCETLKKGPFQSEKNYTDFQNIIKVLKEQSVLKKTENADENDSFFTYEYLCLKCGKKWILKVPDQAYRGGWFEK